MEHAFQYINELDQQVTKAKVVIQKYKDLVVKMQLQINAKDAKYEEVKQEKKKYKDQQVELVARLNQLNINEDNQYRITLATKKDKRPAPTASTETADPATDKLNHLLDEVNNVNLR